MTMSGFKVLAFGIAAVLSSTAASAASFTYNLTNQGNLEADAYNALSFTSTSSGSSLTMQVYGAHMGDQVSKNSAYYSVVGADVAAYQSYGLGVLFGTDSTQNGLHQIDNIGGGVDFVVLQFSQAVTLTSFSRTPYSIGSSTADSDASYMAYTGSITDLLNGIKKTDFTSVSSSSSATTTLTGSSALSSIWIVGASVTSSSDAFKLTSLTFSAVPAAVPEPASWAMMLVGFGAIGATMRSRRVRHTLGHSHIR